MEPRAKHEIGVVGGVVMLNACSIYFFQFNKLMQNKVTTYFGAFPATYGNICVKKNLFVVHCISQCNKHSEAES